MITCADTLVIGGGPAGCACATTLAKGGSDVVLVEAGDYSQPRIGETLAPGVSGLLHTLGIPADDIKALSRQAPAIISSWGHSSELTVDSHIFSPFGPGLHVGRNRLDARLFEQASQAGARAMIRTRVDRVQYDGSQWISYCRCGGCAFEIHSRQIINGTGRGISATVVPGSERMKLDRLVGFGCRISSRKHDPFQGALLIEGAPSGWWYSVQVSEEEMTVVFMTDHDLVPGGKDEKAKFLSKQLGASAYTGDRVRSACTSVEKRHWHGFDAGTGINRKPVMNGCIAIGDSLMSLDPLSGQGVITALQTGITAAEMLLRGDIDSTDAIREWLAGHAVVYNNHLVTRRQIYRMESRWPGRDFWRRRHGGDDDAIAAG